MFQLIHNFPHQYSVSNWEKQSAIRRWNRSSSSRLHLSSALTAIYFNIFFCLPRHEIYRRSVIRMYKSIRKSCNCCITKCIYFSFRFSLCASSEHFLKIFFRRREDAMTAMKLLLRMSKHVLPPFNIFPNELISNYSQFAPKEEMVNYEARLQ